MVSRACCIDSGLCARIAQLSYCNTGLHRCGMSDVKEAKVKADSRSIQCLGCRAWWSKWVTGALTRPLWLALHRLVALNLWSCFQSLVLWSWMLFWGLCAAFYLFQVVAAEIISVVDLDFWKPHYISGRVHSEMYTTSRDDMIFVRTLPAVERRNISQLYSESALCPFNL